MSTTDDDNLTTADLAKRWRVSAGTIRSHRYRGTGPKYFKPSGSKRGRALYRLADVLAYEVENTMGGEQA